MAICRIMSWMSVAILTFCMLEAPFDRANWIILGSTLAANLIFFWTLARLIRRGTAIVWEDVELWLLQRAALASIAAGTVALICGAVFIITGAFLPAWPTKAVLLVIMAACGLFNLNAAAFQLSDRMCGRY